MAAGITFYQFTENLGKGVHNFTSDSTCTLTLALSNVLPVRTNSVLADITQISYTGLSSRVITGAGWEQTLGVAAFAGSDITLTASGTIPPFQYVVLFDDDATGDALIMYWDLVAPVNLVSGQNYLFDIVSGLGQLA